jgi:hypothetical protein
MPSLNTKLATAPNTSSNYVLKATTSTTIGNSLIFDNGTNTAIGGTTITDGNLLNIIGNQSSVNVGLVLNNTNGTYPKIYGIQNVNSNLVFYDYSANATRLTIASTGAATFSSSVTAGCFLTNGASGTAGQEAIRINNNNGYIGLFDGANTTRTGYLQANTSSDVQLMTSQSIPLVFGTANTERMRITSDGNALIGTTNGNPAVNNVTGIALKAGGLAEFSNASDAVVRMNRKTDNGVILGFYKDGGLVGSISTNSNSLPSDRNFKKDISEISLGLNLITKLNPVHYRYNFDDDNEALSNGIIAQELEQSLLECGIEKNSLLMLQHKPNEKEGESQYWVDYTKMIPILIKAIQEQNQLISELSAKVSALENK